MSILRNRSLAALIAAEIVSSLGSRITFLALPWFVLVTTGSAAKMGIVLAVELAPVALLGIPSGAVVARLGARRTMQLSDLARVPLMCSIPLLHSAGLLTFPLLLAIVFLIGCFLAPFFASQRVILPELVGEDETTVAQANAVIEGATTLTNLLGPIVAGLLIAGGRRDERALRRRRHIPALVPDADAVRPLTTAAAADRRRTWRLRRASASSSVTRCSGGSVSPPCS